MFLNGGTLDSVKILNESSIAMMTKNQIGGLTVELQYGVDPGVCRDFPLGVGRDKFGLGFQITALPEEAGHAGNSDLRSPGSYSWAGLYNTHFWVDPARGLAAVILMQVLPFFDETCISVYQKFEGIIGKNYPA
jgi:CubicO group peptidase (beta-lactamase class C family)